MSCWIQTDEKCQSDYKKINVSRSVLKNIKLVTRSQWAKWTPTYLVSSFGTTSARFLDLLIRPRQSFESAVWRFLYSYAMFVTAGYKLHVCASLRLAYSDSLQVNSGVRIIKKRQTFLFLIIFWACLSDFRDFSNHFLLHIAPALPSYISLTRLCNFIDLGRATYPYLSLHVRSINLWNQYL